MDLLSLQSRWSQISSPVAGGETINVLRFPPYCIPQLFLGLDTEGRRCLLLMDDSAVDIPADKHENLSLNYLSNLNTGYIAIRLDNDYFKDLFDDFVASIFNQLYEKESSPELSSEFIRIFLRWSQFFDSIGPRDLSFEALQGLIGELEYMDYLLRDAQPSNVNEKLSAWTGPYHTRTDFILPEKHVEVKGISHTSKQVIISSEYQLEKESGIGIELVVIFLEKDPLDGISLREKLEILKETIHRNHGDFSIILNGLRKLGLSHSNIGIYDNTRFKYRSKTTYDAALDGFPKLVRSTIPASIKSVKYTLKLHELSEFQILEDS